MIKIKGLTFGYTPEHLIFDNVDFQYTLNQRVGLIGANGSGKTTFFYLIMGLLRPFAGEIEIFGKVRRTEKDFEEVRKRIGFLFQNPDDQLFSPTVEEDIAFGPLNLGKTEKEARLIVDKTCKILGIEGYEQRVSYKLSGGEKRLVSLATVVAMEPRILLLDEPTTGLDQHFTEKVINYLNNNTSSYIIASQDMDFLKKTVNKIYQVGKGKIVENETV